MLPIRKVTAANWPTALAPPPCCHGQWSNVDEFPSHLQPIAVLGSHPEQGMSLSIRARIVQRAARRPHHLIQPPVRAAGRSVPMFMALLKLQITAVMVGRIYESGPILRPLDKLWITVALAHICNKHRVLWMIHMLTQHQGFFGVFFVFFVRLCSSPWNK